MAIFKKKKGKISMLTALRMAISKAQDLGFLKKGSLKLTEKGKGKEREHHHDRGEMSITQFERLLRKARKKKS